MFDPAVPARPLVSPPPSSPGRAAWAGLLSFLLPGLGQINAGAWRLGVPLLVVNAILLAGFVVLTRHLAPTPGTVMLAVAWLGVVVCYHIACAVLAARHAWRVRGHRTAGWTFLAAIVAVAVSAIQNAELRPGWRSFSASAESMAPTLSAGDIFIVNQRRPAAPLRHGDVIAFVSPADDETVYAKRVIGLPGDTVALRGGQVVLNGQPVARRPDGMAQVGAHSFQRWIETLPDGRSWTVLVRPGPTPQQERASAVVPPGQVFVLGDHRDNSLDSRFFGPVSLAYVIGPARVVIRPTSLLHFAQALE